MQTTWIFVTHLFPRRGGTARLFRNLACLVFTAACVLPTADGCFPLSTARADSVIDSPMYKIPDLPMRKVILTLPKGAVELWLRALGRPEADLKVKAADAFARAHRLGHKEASAAIGALMAALDQPEQHPTVRLAAAKALITLDARSAAPSLFRQLSDCNTDLRHLIEPALAKWDYAPARALWLERLVKPAATERHLVLAVRGLAAVHEGKAADRLRELVFDEQLAAALRLDAAAALAVLRSEGLESDAEKLAADPAPRVVPLRLLAATLLRRHHSPRAIEILQRLGADPEPAVAAIAVGRLIEIDPALLTPALDRLLANADANLRLQAVEVLFQTPSDQHVGLLADRLDDVHPEVRTQARDALVKLGRTKPWHDAVIDQSMRMLQTDRWRALEQAMILLTQLDHKPAARRFLELLELRKSGRWEVYVTAGWGLRKLDIAETLPAVTEHVQKTYTRLMSGNANDPPITLIDYQLAQLNQFLGLRKHAPADAALRAFVAKRTDRPMYEARAAGIWALGMLHEGKNDPALASALLDRLKDETSIPPEDFRVRFMSAQTLGRMRSKEALESLRKYAPELEWQDNIFGNSLVWAIGQITGDMVPPPKTVQRAPRDWFLVAD